jgi:hypothetical protein
MRRQAIPLDERGNPLGDAHHRTRIPDAVVKAIRDEAERDGIGWKMMAKRHPELVADWIRDVLRYRRRATIPRRWRYVDAPLHADAPRLCEGGGIPPSPPT